MPSGADLEYARLLTQAGVTGSPAGYDGARLEQADLLKSKEDSNLLDASVFSSFQGVREGKVLPLGLAAEWSVGLSGTGTVTDGSDTIYGPYIRISATAASTLYRAGRDLPLKPGKGSAFSFMLRRNDANLSVFDLFQVTNVFDLSTFRQWNKGVSSLAVGAWKRVVVVLSEYETTNPPAADFLTRLLIRITPTAGNVTSIDIADLRFHDTGESEGSVSFIFDDARLDTYTEAFSYMNKRNLPGGVAVEYDQIDVNPSRCTLSHLQEMYEAGWSMHGHHTAQMAPLTEAQQVAVHQASKLFLYSKGFFRGSNLFVWPGGSYNAASEIIAKRYWGSLRRVTSFTTFGIPHVYDPNDPPHRYITAAGTSLALIKGYVDRVKKDGSNLTLTFHSLVESSATAESWLISDFKSLVDYIQSQGIRVIPPSDVWTI